MFIGGCGCHSDEFVYAADNRLGSYYNNIHVELRVMERLERDLTYCNVIVFLPDTKKNGKN